MKTGPNGVAVMDYFEDCSLRAYPDPKTGGAPWTVGRGATGAGIVQGTVWTQQQADIRFAQDIALRDADAAQAIHVPMTQGRWDAFVSILFNVGHGSPIRDGIIRLRSAYPSTLLRLLNAGDYAGARAQFALWISPGSSVELGLRRRRRAEQALWDGATGQEAIELTATHNNHFTRECQ